MESGREHSGWNEREREKERESERERERARERERERDGEKETTLRGTNLQQTSGSNILP